MNLSFLIYFIKLLIFLISVFAGYYIAYRFLPIPCNLTWEEYYADLVEWPEMLIIDSKIVTKFGSFCIGMPYVQLKQQLTDVINEEIDTSESGSIVIKKIDFYGFIGTCTFCIYDGCLNRISIESVIDENDFSHGCKGHIEDFNSFKTVNYKFGVALLERGFGKPLMSDDQKNRIYKAFKAGNLTISVSATDLSHDSDPDICDYSVTIWEKDVNESIFVSKI